MTLGDPYLPDEPEWLIRARAGLPPIKKTSELPVIIPPLPKGDTNDLKVWHEYWKQHDKKVRHDELQDFDRWFSARHVCAQSPLIKEVRQELHRRMQELRKEGGEQR
jgi:SET domain-containing protein